MRTLDDALAEMVGKYTITLEEAMTRAIHPDQLRKMFESPVKKDWATSGKRN
jgi:Tfp pilus assembly ATPase PilU